MLPGDIRTFRGDKAVAVTLGVWAEKRGKWIFINMTGNGISFKHILVNNNPKSTMYHRTLFRDLRQLLIENNKWTFGKEGAETENKEL